MQTARQGGFEDLNGNNLPDGPEEWDRVMNATGVAGSYGLPDSYFESSNTDDIRDKLLMTINSV